MSSNRLLTAYDSHGTLLVLVISSPEGPRLVRPAAAGNSGVGRLILPAPASTTDAPTTLVLDLLERKPGTSGNLNSLRLTTIPAPTGPPLLQTVEFDGEIRVFLSVNTYLHVHGKLSVEHGELQWQSLHCHADSQPMGPSTRFDVTKSLVGQLPIALNRTSRLPLAELLGLQTPEVVAGFNLNQEIPLVGVEIVPAPLPAPAQYTGDDLVSQLVSRQDHPGPLVVRIKQQYRLRAIDQTLTAGPLEVKLTGVTIHRAKLDVRCSIELCQTHSILDADGAINTSHNTWICRVNGLPMLPALRAYSNAAAKYLSSLQTVQDGRPISGVPLFDTRTWDGVTAGHDADSEKEFRRKWMFSFMVHDSLDESVNLTPEVARESVRVHFRAAFPSGNRDDDQSPSKAADVSRFKYACWLPGMARHDFYLAESKELAAPYPGVVAMDCVIDAVSDIFEQKSADAAPADDVQARIHENRQQSRYDSVWRGFVFQLRRFFRPEDIGRPSDPEKPLQWVRIGALDLAFAPALDPLLPTDYDQHPDDDGVNTDRGIVPDGLRQRQLSTVTLGWRESRGNWSPDVPSVALEWLHRVSQVVAGGQDGLPNDTIQPSDVGDDNVRSLSDDAPSAVNQRFLREPSLVIHTSETELLNRAAPPFLMRMREYTSAMQSQVLVMNLFEWVSRDESQEPNSPIPLLVIDRHPFTVGMVLSPPLKGIAGADGNLEVGNWSANGFDGASWELAGATDGFFLRFPPQVVGEGMEKRTDETQTAGNGYDVIDGKPAQFRLSPLAQFELQSSYFRQNFTEAVWNLRRILGYPGQRAPGAGVRRLWFELLYGMGCEVSTDNLRLAELSARLGAVPGALPAQIAQILGRDRLSHELDFLEIQQLVFRRLNYRWSRIFHAYQSRLGIYQPWQNFEDRSLTLKEKVQYEVRDPLLITQNPVKPDPHEPNKPQPTLLAGGALWGFDFRAQYEPFRDSQKMRRSTSGELSRPAFSALGGWGHQKAVFDGGLTTIYSDTAMGRTFFYSVERRGRINCFYNYAKHVVIYERSVATAKQFRPVRDTTGAITGPTQDHLAGRPVLRKVQEYIEILQRHRTYPDLGGSEVARGCVQSIEFVKSIIPIDYRWGRDITDAAGKPIGYVIPLWRPDADPVIYPRPHINLRLAGGSAPGESLACEVTDPQKLMFFSVADNPSDEEVNTDTWPAVRSVDYPDVMWPKPAAPMLPPDLEAPQPDEVVCAPGYEAFTYNITSVKPVDVVANRSDQATAALIHNVSMVRADPIADAAKSPDATAAQSATVANEGIHKSRESLDNLRQLVNGDLRTDAVRKAIADAATQLQTALFPPTSGGTNISVLENVKTVFAGGNMDLLKNPRNWQHQTESAMKRWATSASMAVDKVFDQRLLKSLDKLPPDLAKAKEEAKRTLRENWDLFRLSAPAIDPGIGELINGAQRAIDLPRTMRTAITSRIRSLHELARQVLDYELLDIVPSPSAVRELNEAAAQFQRDVVGIIRAQIDRAGDELGPYLQNGLLDGCRRLINRANKEVGEWRRSLAERMELTAYEILQAFDEPLAWLNTFETAVGTELGAIANAIKSLEDKLKALGSQKLLLDAAGNALKVFGQDATTDLLGRVDRTVKSDELLKLVESKIDAAANAAQIVSHIQEARNAIDSAAKRISDKTAKLTDYVSNVQNYLDDFASGPVAAKLLKPINDATQLETRMRNAVQQLLPANLNTLLAKSDLDESRAELQKALGSAKGQFDDFVNGLTQPLAGRFTTGIVQKGGDLLRMVRAFGEAPLVQGMEFTRKQLGYFYDPLSAIKGSPIDMTPAVALVNRYGGHLKALGVNLPSGKLLDQVLPPADDLMKQLDFGKLLPDFAGIKLDKLFPELKSPEGLKDKVKVTQSFDKQAGRGWVQADVRVPVEGPSTVFDAGALKVSVRDALLTAQMRIEAGISGNPKHHQFGKLVATWDLALGGTPLISFEETMLSFDESGKTKFTLDPTKVRMNGVLQMLSDVMKSVSTDGDGFVLRLKEENGMPVGIEALLDLPLPDLTFGAVAMANLRFGVQFELVAVPEFAIGLRVNICEKKLPFTLAIFILGGGGWLVAKGRYLPFSNRLTTAVSLGLSAGAMLAIAFGPVKGCVFAFFYVEGELQTDSDRPGNRQLVIRIGLLLGGDVDVCGIITVSIRLLLEMEYDGSALTGRGTLSIRVKVCFFLTISFSRTVEKKLAGGGNRDSTPPQNRMQRVQDACDKHLERTK